MRFYAITDIGRVRPINEDAYYLPAGEERFCAVADGMGGHNAGEVASSLAVKVFAEHMRSVDCITASDMHDAVAHANTEVFKESGRDASKSGMGTTFTALAFEGGAAHIAHVGDSRAYLVRRGTIMPLTTDHTLVEEMVLKGLITVREARVHPKRNIITRALGTGIDVEIDLIQLEVRPGDVFFLCSDGLTNHVTDKQILKVAASHESWQDKLRHLVTLALEDGGPDNITAMFAVYEEAVDR